MRIIAGKFKSRIIQMPKGVKVRPTQDRVRESIFSILGTKCIDANVLDLYSGSGAFGIEALSRGAKEAVFVDSDVKCIDMIRRNLNGLNILQDTNILRLEAIKAVKKFGRGEKRFDLIFLDPPYYKNLIEKTLKEIDNCDIITRFGMIVAEHSKKDRVPEAIGKLSLLRHSAYGDTVVSFYK